VLLAASSGRIRVDRTVMDAVLGMVRYQLDARREVDPVDAEGTIATMEEKIRRALARGSLTERDLKRRVHYNRVGIWAWETALGNLIRTGEVARNREGFYWLVTTSVTTTQNGVLANVGAHI
jgi:hypothetical protein